MQDDMPLTERLARVVAQLNAAALAAGRSTPRLVAVSKTKPIEAIQELYDAGQRHFGENYVQELLDKAPRLPRDIRWHFIGSLQSNKAKALVTGVPGLWAIESVDSPKLAAKLEAAAALSGRTEPLQVFVQVNTTGEPQKGGVEDAAEAASLCTYIASDCPNLRLAGLMTVGRLGDTDPACFDMLAATRDAVYAALSAPAPVPGGAGASSVPVLELSMGMSADWELAVAHGSTNVRVGSAIFGAREYAPGKGPAAALAARAAAAAAAGSTAVDAAATSDAASSATADGVHR